MNVTAENIEFVTNYIEKHVDSIIRHELEGMRLNDKIAFFRGYELDKDTYKRMMTAYRADKKRKLDKDSGNSLVNVSITNKAHIRLKAFANMNDVTLSQFIEEYMDDKCMHAGLLEEIDRLREQLNNANNSFKSLSDKQSELVRENIKLKERNGYDYDSEEKTETIKPKLVKLGQCCALTANGQRCKSIAYFEYKEGNLCHSHNRVVYSTGVKFV